MKPTIEYEKLEALKNHLVENENFTTEEASAAYYDERFESFCCGSWEYKVLTWAEADTLATAEILESLWAFRARFILYHTDFYKNSTDREDEAFVEALESLQGKLCESANPIIKALIRNLPAFVQDAIDEDGRGQFISHYDGEEIESGEFFLYRIN